MGKRSAREVALQVLFEVDLAGAEVGPALFRAFLRGQEKEVEEGVAGAKLSDVDKASAKRLAEGVVAHRADLDATIAALAKGWEVPRMPGVDRNLMRIAIYEIEHEQVPVGLAINEAVELAKTYSTPDSSRFVNGVLAGYLKRRSADGAGADGATDTDTLPDPVANPE